MVGANVTLKVYRLPFLKAAPADACQTVPFARLNGPAPDGSRSKPSARGRNRFARDDEEPSLCHEVMMLAGLSGIPAVMNSF